MLALEKLDYVEIVNNQGVRVPKEFRTAFQVESTLQKWYDRILERQGLSSKLEYFEESTIDFSDKVNENKYSNTMGLNFKNSVKKSVFQFENWTSVDYGTYGYFKVNVLELTKTHIRVILKHYSPQNKLIMSGRMKFKNKKYSSQKLLNMFLSYSNKCIVKKVSPLPVPEKVKTEKETLHLEVFKDFETYKNSKKRLGKI